MADGVKISQLPQLLSADVDDTDELVIVDVSEGVSKKITRSKLLGSAFPTVDINGGTIDNTVIGGTTPAAITGTTITGTTITGTSFVSSGDMTFGNNDKAVFGDTPSLEIYSDGSLSRIRDIGTGNLYIQATNLIVEATDGTNYIFCEDDGPVTLYYNNSSRLATSNAGITVTGTATASGFTGDLTGDVTGNLTGNVTSTGSSTFSSLDVTTLSIGSTAITATAAELNYVDGVTSNIQTQLDTKLSSISSQSIKNLSDVYSLMAPSDGQILVWDSVNSRWQAEDNTGGGGGGSATLSGVLANSNTTGGYDINVNSGSLITFGDNNKAVFGAGSDLEIYHDGSNSYISETGTGYLTISSGTDLVLESAGGEKYIHAIGNEGVTSYYNGVAKLATTVDGITVTGDTVSLTHTGNSSTLSFTQKEGTQNSVATIGSNREDTTTSASRLQFSTNDGTSTLQRMRIKNTGDVVFYDSTGTSEQFYWDASESILSIGSYNGSGTPSGSLFVESNSSNHAIHIEETGGLSESWQIGVDTNGDLGFYNSKSTTASVTFADSDNVGIGDTAPSEKLNVAGNIMLEGGDQYMYLTNVGTGNSGIYIRGNTAGTYLRSHSTGLFTWEITGSEKMRLSSNGRLGIGTSSGTRTLDVLGTIRSFSSSEGDYGTGLNLYADSGGTGHLAVYQMLFKTGSNNARTEAARINPDGHFIVGKDSTAIEDVGTSILSTGRILSTADGDDVLVLRRNTSHGNMVSFRKDGSVIGTIGNPTGYFCIFGGNSGGTHAGFRFVNLSSIRPCDTAGGNLDNTIDLGSSASRFDDIWATNGTIQTSDANEKQQISALTEAEINAAKAISKLFKTYKWNSSVESKGTDARIRTGVIAQEVEQAMSDAGLDASRYGFWCNNTWFADANGEEVDEGTEGATERNLKGVRYPELLSFIGAATEQRLASIEARLDALEAI